MSLSDAITAAEAVVLQLKQEIEDAFPSRCAITSSDCTASHNSACSSVRSGATCEADGVLDECEEESCGYLVDKTLSVVRIPAALADGESGNPTEASLIEAACFSGLVEDSLKSAYDDNNERYGLEAAFFGSWSGVFRYFPGIAEEECGNFDTRLRPWFVGASSGPKDVIIILDTSGSMRADGKMELAIEAVQTVLTGMTFDHYVNVISFDSSAEVLSRSTDSLLQATEENLLALSGLVGQLSPNGGTNFYEAFDLAFDLIESSVANGNTAGCHTTILFLTDGEISDGPLDPLETTGLIETRNADIGAEIFTFSFGEDADQDTTQAIACETDGVYRHVSSTDDLTGAMASYYQLYAIGSGNSSSQNLTTWTEPYIFDTGGQLGTTCAASAYDHSTSPSTFLGVVAVDFKLSTFTDLNVEYSFVLDRLVAESSTCPVFELSECDKQAYRASISDASVCANQCESTQELTPEDCMPAGEYPRTLWTNTDAADWSYVERACCDTGSEADASLQEPTCFATTRASGDALSGAAIAGIVVISVAAACLCCVLFWRRYKRPTQGPAGAKPTPSAPPRPAAVGESQPQQAIPTRNPPAFTMRQQDGVPKYVGPASWRPAPLPVATLADL